MKYKNTGLVTKNFFYVPNAAAACVSPVFTKVQSRIYSINLLSAVTLDEVFDGGGVSPGSRDMLQWAVGLQQQHSSVGCSCGRQRSQHSVPAAQSTSAGPGCAGPNRKH